MRRVFLKYLLGLTVLLGVYYIYYDYYISDVDRSKHKFPSHLTEKIQLDKNYGLSTKISLLNLHSFHYLINNDLCLLSKPKYIVLVTSHANNVEARSSIRKSFPRDVFQKFNVLLIFSLGVPQNTDIVNHGALIHENNRYNDIIQGNFLEAYRNLTYKHIMGLQWAYTSCSTAKYIIKMDDDIVVNFYKLFETVQRHNSSQMIGCVIKKMKAIRAKQNKWYVTYQEYFEPVYPTFLSGWMYIATIETVGKLLEQSRNIAYFWIDDVFVTGMLAKKANISHVDIRSLFRYDPKYIECCINDNYMCDFVAAPSGGDYELQVKFSQHIWECKYKKICLANNMSSFTKPCVTKLKEHPISQEGFSYIRKLG